MSRQIPLGKAEGQKLEFKGRESLRHLPNVSRQVVAMLNSGGGEIWIGIGEENGRAVRVEAIEHPDRDINRLRDHFSDSIEPSPISGEISVEAIDGKSGGPVLRVETNPSKPREPYALRDGTGRHFLKRVDDRLRAMSSEEIAQRFAQRTGAEHPQRKLTSAFRIAQEKVQAAQERHRREQVLWLRIQPVGGPELKLDDTFQDYFHDPHRTGNRNAGWNFIDPYRRIDRGIDSIRFGESGATCVYVFRDGAIDFAMPTINLYWKSAINVPNRATTKEIWPYCLLEYPTSVFRLAATIYKELEFNADCFLADLGVFGLKDWTLRPHSPVSLNYKLADPKQIDGDEIVLDEPITLTRHQVVQEPDRCAFRLVTQVYRRFEIWEDEMPPEFNQETGKLVLPGSPDHR